MAGYRVGSKAWVEHVKQRIIDTGVKLQSKDLSEEEREAVYRDHVRHIVKLHDYAEANGIV